MDFDGYAIGGVSVGEPEPEMMKAVEISEPHLPAHKARYAMGLGTPAQMVELVARGVDMFDCVLPTRVARNGTAFTSKGTFAIKGGAVKADFGPIEEGCGCFACRHHTRAYIRHLLNVDEILGLRLVSIHNSHYYLEVMRQILVDHARARSAAKRGGGVDAVIVDDLDTLPLTPSDAHILGLDDALTRLASLDERQARIVELRYFAGLSVDDTAKVLSVSPRTVKREWRLAKVWLFGEMTA